MSHARPTLAAPQEPASAALLGNLSAVLGALFLVAAPGALALDRVHGRALDLTAPLAALVSIAIGLLAGKGRVFLWALVIFAAQSALVSAAFGAAAWALALPG